MDILHAIMDIEQKAQNIINSTSELKQNQNTILSEEIEKRKAKMDTLLKEECSKLEKDAMERHTKDIENLERAYDKKLAVLEQKCRANKEKWVADIFSSVTGE